MSSSIWTRCAGDSEIRALRLLPWRIVESQYQVSTRKLVDSNDEQALLEDLLDGAKPPAVGDARQHYLLTTPFRYPPLTYGSRFGMRHERGIWYGSETIPTALAEVAYYRLLFLDGSTAQLGLVTTALTAFRASARSRKGMDLVRPPFDAHKKAIASPTRYAASQALGAAMRAAGVELFRYPSARDPRGGVNVGAFVPGVFGKGKPRDFQAWHCTATTHVVEFARREYFAEDDVAFVRSDFLVNDALPAPAV